ncbi:MAG: sulfite exporter TauE/SafE family protein [Candidatus Altiarchaeota archaeon]|nr:sulfite exporter TauE/SafE family protein [Candidatus Altiarchaeota archaeon]
MAVKSRKHAGVVKTVEFNVDGMSCTSCEKIIEKKAKSVPGVIDVRSDYSTGKGVIKYDSSKTSVESVLNAIGEGGYKCSLEGGCRDEGAGNLLLPAALLAILILVYLVLTGMNFSVPDLEKDISLPIILVVGLLTGFHCVAMCGGFVVSYTAKEALKKRSLNLGSHLSYGAGKTISYTVLGAFFGLVGSLITFTPELKGIAALIAGFFLIMFGLNMLGMLGFFRRFRFETPAFIEKFVSKRNDSSPFVIGLLNGLMIACGPLQAMYILSAASGSAFTGATYMFVFGVGTLPVLLGFGMLTSFVSSKFTQKLLKLSGVVVILLGLIMVGRGLALAGIGFDAGVQQPQGLGAVANYSTTPGGPASGLPVVYIDSEGYQVIRMNVTASGWKPDKFVLKAGVPVKWVIDGQQITSCNKAIQVPKYGLQFDVKKGTQTITFTPGEPGLVRWSCWMGMIWGSFDVRDDVEVRSVDGSVTASAPAPSTSTTLGSGVQVVLQAPKAQPQADSAGYQTIYMNVTAAGWIPNKFVLKAGVPVKWVIDGQELTGCNSGIKVPSLGLDFKIKPGVQTIEFTPSQAGTIDWSCWMGMIKGKFIVEDGLDLNDASAVQSALDSVQVQKSGGGCGCGMMGGG